MYVDFGYEADDNVCGLASWLLVTWVNIENTLECIPNLATDSHSWAMDSNNPFCECIASSQCII